MMRCINIKQLFKVFKIDDCVFDTLGDTKDGSDPNGQDFLPLPGRWTLEHGTLDSMESTEHTLGV